MDVFFDTSVLVAASEQSHPHYTQAHSALRRVVTGLDKGFMSVHSIAELYAALTRLPVRPRIQPMDAMRIVTENILPHFEAVPVGKRDYIEALKAVATGGRSGAKIYDALLLGCAARCKVERIYTFNLVDFRELAPTELQDKICAP